MLPSIVQVTFSCFGTPETLAHMRKDRWLAAWSSAPESSVAAFDSGLGPHKCGAIYGATKTYLDSQPGKKSGVLQPRLNQFRSN